VNILIDDDSNSVKSVDYDGKSGEALYPMEFLNGLSPSGLPSLRLNLKLNTSHILHFAATENFTARQISDQNSVYYDTQKGSQADV
jgi:hypothetical protein